MKRRPSPQKLGPEEYLLFLSFVCSAALTLASFAAAPFRPDAAAVMTRLSHYSYAWLCSVSVSQCVRHNMHLRIGLLESRLSPAAARRLGLFSQAACFLVILGMFAGSFLLLRGALVRGEADAAIPRLPLALAYFAPVVGYGLALVRSVLCLLKGGGRR